MRKDNLDYNSYNLQTRQLFQSPYSFKESKIILLKHWYY